MSSDSLRKDIARATLVTLFRVVGFALGLVVVFIIFGWLFSSPGTPSRSTTPDVLPNHDWQVKNFSTHAPTILQLDMKGVVGLNRHMTKDEVKKILVESIDADLKPGQVKALLLHINTPGGTAEDSDGIYNLIKEYKAKLSIPVIAYVDGMCASGGMYIACAADKVYATKSSIVGSVGVIMPPAFNFTSLMERLGIQSTTIFAGRGKDELNPFRPWRPDEAASYQSLINSTYDQFMDIVSTARPLLTKATLLEVGARIFTAQESLNKGYIDEINDSYFNVLETLASSLGIRDSYQVVQLQTGNILSDLFSSESASMISGMISGSIEHHIRVPGDIDPSLAGKLLYLYHPTDSL